MMVATTLVTFDLLLENAVTVDLLGSWDNFTNPIKLHRDKRRSQDQWTVCPSFSHLTQVRSSPDPYIQYRNGLEQGRTYYYFYRVDGEEERIDPSQDVTTTCSLLPGQLVNTLYVPSDGCVIRDDDLPCDLDPTSPWTLDPSMRKQNPQPNSAFDDAHAHGVKPSLRKVRSEGNKLRQHWSSMSLLGSVSWMSLPLTQTRRMSDPLTMLEARMNSSDSRATTACSNPDMSAMILAPDGMSLIRRYPYEEFEATEDLGDMEDDRPASIIYEESIDDRDHLADLMSDAVLDDDAAAISVYNIEEINDTAVAYTSKDLDSPTDANWRDDYFGSFASTVPSTDGIRTPRRPSVNAGYSKPLSPFKDHGHAAMAAVFDESVPTVTFSTSNALDEMTMKDSTVGVKQNTSTLERFINDFDYLGAVVY